MTGCVESDVGAQVTVHVGAENNAEEDTDAGGT